MGKASTGFFVPTTGSSVQVETVGFTPASGFQDLAVRSLGIGGPASGTAGQITGPTASDITVLAGGTNNAVLQAGNAGTRTGGYVKAFYGTTDGSVACVPGAAVGANLTGGALTLQEGQGTGTGTGGGINFYTVPIGSSGSGLNATALTSTLTGIQNNLAGTAQVWRIFPTFADGGVTSAAGMQTLSVNPTINCTAASRTGNYVALAVSVNETSLPTGPNHLLLLQAGAVGSTTMFSVRNDGGTVLGAATGGYQGAGTLNAVALYVNGAAVGGAPSLSTVLAVGNTTGANNIIFSASQNAQWATGGTFSATAPEILGPTDTGTFISSGTPTNNQGNGLTLTASDGKLTGPGATSGGTITATAGRGATNAATPSGFGAVLTLTGASSTGAGGGGSLAGGASLVGSSNAASGGLVFDMGNSTGNATEVINFKGPPTGGSGTGTNTSISLVQLNNKGTLTWQSGLGSSINHIVGPSDQVFNIQAAVGTTLNVGAGQVVTVQVNGSQTMTLGAGLVLTSVSSNGIFFVGGGGSNVNGVIGWGTGYGAITHIKGPTDQPLAFAASPPAGSGNGNGFSITGGNGTTAGTGGTTTIKGGQGVGTDQAAGGVTIDTGRSTGAGTGQILFNVQPIAASGTGINTTSTVLTIDPSGFVYAGLQNVTTVGNVSLTASKGGSTSGAGGNVSLIGGAAGTAGGATGTANLTGGANAIASGSTAGGQVNITGGACSGTTSTGAGGAFVATGGLGGTTSGTGGAASLTGGAGQGSTSGAGGLASLVGGAGSTGSSNNASGGCLLSTGASSGTGFSNITARTSFTLATGSTAQTIGDRLMICGKTLVLSNTTGTATAFASLSTTSGAGLGGTCFYTVVASDGTEWSSASGQFDFSVVNKAGTLTVVTPLIQTENIANSTGATLATTGTPTVVASGTNVLLKVTPAFSGTNAASVTSCKVSWEIVLRGSVSTVTPQ